MQNVQLLIHDKSLNTANCKTFKRISPIDGQVASIAAAATVKDVESAIASAHDAFQIWSKRSPTERRLSLLESLFKLNLVTSDLK